MQPEISSQKATKNGSSFMQRFMPELANLWKYSGTIDYPSAQQQAELLSEKELAACDSATD